MSSISSAISSQSLFPFLYSMSNQQTSQGNNVANSQDGSVQGAGRHGHHGHHHGGGMFQQIQAAVTAALQGSQSSSGGTSSSSDPNQVIQNAIAQVLQGNSTTSTAGTSQTSDSDGDGSTAASSSTNNATNGGPQAFMQMLQNAGVSQQQFMQDFMAAIQQVQGTSSQSSSNSLLTNLQPGLNVDVTG